MSEKRKIIRGEE